MSKISSIAIEARSNETTSTTSKARSIDFSGSMKDLKKLPPSEENLPPRDNKYLTLRTNDRGNENCKSRHTNYALENDDSSDNYQQYNSKISSIAIKARLLATKARSIDFSDSM